MTPLQPWRPTREEVQADAKVLREACQEYVAASAAAAASSSSSSTTASLSQTFSPSVACVLSAHSLDAYLDSLSPSSTSVRTVAMADLPSLSKNATTTSARFFLCLFVCLFL